MSRRSDELPFEKKRIIVLHEADWICAYCGGDADEADHIWPRKLGGGDEFANLQAICRSCNASKGSSFYLSDITPGRCDLMVTADIEGTKTWAISAAKWLAVKADVIDGEDPVVAYRTYTPPKDGPGRPPRADEIRAVLSRLWVELLHETPGQAALDALTDLKEWHLIDASSEVVPR